MQAIGSQSPRLELLRLKLRVVELELQLYARELELLKDGWHYESSRPTRNEQLLTDIKTIYHRVWEQGYKALLADRVEIRQEAADLLPDSPSSNDDD